MRVLAARDRGYVGSVLVPLLRAGGHQVGRLDFGRYEGWDVGLSPQGVVGWSDATVPKAPMLCVTVTPPGGTHGS